MEFYHQRLSTTQPTDRKEIEERLTLRYLDRLQNRVKQLRKLLANRNWEAIRVECDHLVMSGHTFPFPILTEAAQKAKASIPDGRLSRAAVPVNAKEEIIALISILDQILLEHPRYHA